jgi:hypothetical protein
MQWRLTIAYAAPFIAAGEPIADYFSKVSSGLKQLISVVCQRTIYGLLMLHCLLCVLALSLCFVDLKKFVINKRI